MKKRIVLVILLISALLSMVFYAHAHSGRTDENGGHYDGQSGEYHYHHGYPAHSHANGECPYEFDDNTSHNYSSNSNSNNSTKETESSTVQDSFTQEFLELQKDEIEKQQEQLKEEESQKTAETNEEEPLIKTIVGIMLYIGLSLLCFIIVGAFNPCFNGTNDNKVTLVFSIIGIAMLSNMVGGLIAEWIVNLIFWG